MTTNERRLPSLQAALRHRWATVLVITLLGFGAGSVYTVSLDPTYTSSAVVLLNPVPANPLTPEAASGSGVQFTVALETEAEVVASPAVAEGVTERLGRLVPDEDEYLDVEVPAGTQMVRISFTTGDAGEAEEGAQAFAEIFLSYREDRATDYVAMSLGSLQAEAEEVELGLQEALRSRDDADDRSLPARQVDLGVDRLAALNSQIGALRGMATDPGRVLQPAREPSAPNGPSSVLLLGALGMLGVAFGIAVAWYREWSSEPIVEATALEVEGVPIFAAVPGREQSATSGDAIHESFRHLRAALVANALRPHTLAVYDIGTDQDAPMVASNLAIVLTEAQYSVLLIEADPEGRTVETAMGLDEESPGLAEVLTGEREAKEVLVKHGYMTVMPGGRTPASVRELYAGPRFRQTLDDLRGGYDFVILSTASTKSGVGDGVTSTADSVLLVVNSGMTTHVQVAATLDRFGRLGVRAIGAVALAGGRRLTLLEANDESVMRERGARVGV